MATPAPEAALKGGVQVGRVLGVPVLVAPSWLLFAAVIVLSYGPALTDRFGTTHAEEAAGEDLDHRLAQEEPDAGAEPAAMPMEPE